MLDIKKIREEKKVEKAKSLIEKLGLHYRIVKLAAKIWLACIGKKIIL